jgi:putative membrane protein
MEDAMLHTTTLGFFGMHLFWWAFWILLILALSATVTAIPKSQMRSGERALDILRRQYAAGRFSTEEYERRKAVLERDESDRVTPAASARANQH